MKRLRLPAWPALVALLAGGCGSSEPNLTLNLTADDVIDQYDLYLRQESDRSILLHTGWSDATKMMKKDPRKEPFKLGLKMPKEGSYAVILIGVAGATEGDRPALGAKQLFYAGKVNVPKGGVTLEAKLISVNDLDTKATDDQDRDLFPDAITWPMNHPAAAAMPPDLLDCNDKMDLPKQRLTADKMNPFAKEVCGNDLDENCEGGDEKCVDSDDDGEPDSTDCKPMDPAIHHPIIDPAHPKYDPYPEIANCCGYNLGKSGPDGQKSFAMDKLCHAKSCGDGVDQDCSAGGDPAGDVACVIDSDCDTFAAAEKQEVGCMSTGQKGGTDCNDCDPAINSQAPEICDQKDNNCNGAVDETCVGCDLDGDGFQRNDPKNGCPNKQDMNPGKFDCNDFDTGVFPGSTAMCQSKEGGVKLCALRGYCRNKNPDATAQDEDCDGKANLGCPDPACDADGDGYPGNKMGCAAMGIPVDCNDMNPTIFPGAPDKCADGIVQNCVQDLPCGMDKDGDKYDVSTDCDDNDKTVSPWAVEKCNGRDDDCDGLKDEGNPDGNGDPMVDAMNKIYTRCTASNVGLCGKDADGTKRFGTCVCSANSIAAQQFNQGARLACPGENAEIDTGAKSAISAPRCYGAKQPAPQSCDPKNAQDDDCDGRSDAPDGVNLKDKGAPCWPGAKGVCGPAKGGKVIGCKMVPMGQSANCFNPANVNPWWICDVNGPPACPGPERCNGLDDDCDEKVPDDERDLDGDGYVACGSPHLVYNKSGAKCEMALAMGLQGCGDCQDAVGMTMGQNNNKINPGAKDACDALDNDCNPTSKDGTSDCPGGPGGSTCCGAIGCKDTAKDAAHCGTCNTACNLANANPVCAAATCAATSCKASPNGPHGYGDCDGNAANGCETDVNINANHCSKCGNKCPVPNNGLPICDKGVCGIGSCNDPSADCDGDKNTGCEIDTSSNPAHCGGCGKACALANVQIHSCAAKTCGVMLCNKDFKDCDKSAPNGCEVNYQSNADHCGDCGMACSKTNIAAACTAGGCTGACNAGFLDCNTDKRKDGCEINSRNDPKNCGGCGLPCDMANVGHACVNGACGCNVVGDCNAKTADKCTMGKCACGGAAACNPALANCVGGKCLLLIGQVCKLDGDCLSGSCEPGQNDNRCGPANVFCKACEVITPDGMGCTPATKGSDPKKDCATNVLGTTCVASACGCVDKNNCRADVADTCSGGVCQCGNSPVCNPNVAKCSSGQCLKLDGVTCTNDNQCLNGHCLVAQPQNNMSVMLCSALVGCGKCKVVDPTGKMCVNSSGGFDPGSVCQNDPNGRSCVNGTCGCTVMTIVRDCDLTTPGANQCVNSKCQCGNGATCNTAVNECVGTAPAGSCKKRNGQTCAAGAECASGNCIAGQSGLLCSKVLSCPACQVIDPTGTMCTFAALGSDPKMDCKANNNGRVCLGNGNCGCNANPMQCDTNTANLCTGMLCKCGNGNPCDPATQKCNNGACVGVSGQTCNNNGDCATGNCQQGQTGKRCATMGLTCGVCQVVNDGGTACINANAGTDPKNNCAANTDNKTCNNGACGCTMVNNHCDVVTPTADACNTTCRCGGMNGGSACNPMTEKCTAMGCKKKNGQPCVLLEDCATGFCQITQGGSKVCNAAACTECKVAAADGSGCVNATNDPKNNCTNSTAGKVCVSGACGCAMLDDCIANSADSCATTCKCNGGSPCDTTTQKCVMGVGCSKKDGQTCVAPADCASNFCETTQAGAKVCAAMACGLCKVAKADGSGCDNAMGDPKNQCATSPSGKVCNAGACGCLAPADCLANSADSCATTCKCNGGAPCDTATQQCVMGMGCKKKNGQTCAAGGECATGFCETTQAGGKVCNSVACTTCTVAMANGQGCANADDGTDPTNSCAANNAGHKCYAGNCGCNADSECVIGLAPFCIMAEKKCGCGAANMVCNAGTQLCTALNAIGLCRKAPAQACTAGMDAECASTAMNACENGQDKCKKMADGQPCTVGGDCQSATCTAGVCQ